MANVSVNIWVYVAAISWSTILWNISFETNLLPFHKENGKLIADENRKTLNICISVFVYFFYFRNLVLCSLCKELLCPKFTEPISSFLLPAISQSPSSFPVKQLLQALVSTNQNTGMSVSHVEVEPSPWLLYSVMTLVIPVLGTVEIIWCNFIEMFYVVWQKALSSQVGHSYLILCHTKTIQLVRFYGIIIDRMISERSAWKIVMIISGFFPVFFQNKIIKNHTFGQSDVENTSCIFMSSLRCVP